MSLSDRLEATPPAPEPRTIRTPASSGFKYDWDGNAGFIETGPLGERPRTWDTFIKDSGLDPEEVEVIEPVQVRGWDAAAGGGDTVRMHYYRLTVRRRTLKRDLDELIEAAKSSTASMPLEKPSEDARAFLVALGDLQLGKADGDGVEGTVGRFLQSSEDAVKRYKRLRLEGAVGPIYLSHLGDCIEGFVSQGGALAWRTTLTITEQVRLYRRLLLEQIKMFAPLTENLVMVGIPGNHDEANRPLMTYGDSWAIDAVSAVRDALELSGAYENVHLFAPARDELTLTLDMCGTKVGMAHGHQWRGKPETWLANQAIGRTPIGDADILLSAHLHHLSVLESGPRTLIQVPALESESTWWRHRTGKVSRAGIVTAIVGGGGWSGLEVL